jgi:rubrerythrin
MRKNKPDNLADFLFCSSVLEERTSSLYKTVAEKVDVPLVRSLLLYIAHDSQKHAAILKGVSESIGKPVAKAKDCDKRFRESAVAIEHISREISERKILKLRGPELIEKLTMLESTIGEEYYMLVQLKTLKYMQKEIRETTGIEVDNLKDIFETIIKDEELHSELLSKMKNAVVAVVKESEPKAPEVKYTHPDSWSRAMPDSVYESTT